MWARDLSRIRFTGERERNISGAFALAVNDWAERTHTEQNIERSASLTCSGCILFCWIWLLTYIYIYMCVFYHLSVLETCYNFLGKV